MLVGSCRVAGHVGSVRPVAPAASRTRSKRLNRLRFFWTRIWGKTCVWKRS
ncbi:MAG: hypothetical protein VB143_00840 [Burkholderia sp.]